MNIYNILGYILISLPFIGMGIFVVKMGSWKDLFTLIIVVGLIVMTVMAGAHLITLP